MPSHLSPRVRALVALLVLLKAAAWFTRLPHGLEASYFAGPQWKDPVATRIDTQLSLGGERANDPPAVSAIWRGYVPVRAGVDRQRLYLRGKGLTAELWVDGIQAVHLDPPAEEAVERAPWPAATHHIVVRMTRQPDSPPPPLKFDAGFVLPDGAMVPFGERAVLVKPAPGWRIAADQGLRPLNPWLNVLLVSILTWVAWRTVDFMVPPEEQ